MNVEIFIAKGEFLDDIMTRSYRLAALKLDFFELFEAMSFC